MKILLDIPDGTICAFLNYLIQSPDGLRMCVNSLQSEDLNDGAKIKIIPAETEGGEILDTHAGSASSLVACYDLGFDFVGFEIDEEYYRLASERLDAVKAQLRFNLQV